MTILSCHTAVLLIGVYVLAGLAPIPRGRTKALIIAFFPALAGSWLIGFTWPGGALVVLAFVVSMTGYHFQENVENAAWWLIAQGGVLASLFSFARFAENAEPVPPAIAAGMALIAGLAVTVEWGGACVGRAIQPFAEALTEPPQREIADGLVERRGLPGGFPDGGKMIGRLERLLVFLFVIVGTPAAIGFLIAAKSVLRFGEIKDSDSRKAAEYIIIGTLMSFSFALVTSYLTRLALMALLTGSPLEEISLGGLGYGGD